MLEICAIASGSNGNCYYIGNKQNAILVDAGISGKQICNRMEDKGLDPSKVKAVFVTHEHGDHMRGVRGISKKLQIPVYLTAKTYNGAYKNTRPDSPKYFTPEDVISVEDFTIYPVLKNHDAAEPCSFRIQHKNKSIGVFTDIGAACKRVEKHISECDGLFLEANYDENMLWEGHYPTFLKERVASELGHLSNTQAFDLLNKHASNRLQSVFLSHISKDNNTHEKVLEIMQPLANKFHIELATRQQASSVFRFQES